jgi:hypothetical protein
MTNYKGRLARLVWGFGEREVYGRLVDHTEVFIFEYTLGDATGLDPENPPRNVQIQIITEDSIAYISTDLLGKKGSMLLLTAPTQIRLEKHGEKMVAQCDMPCRIQTLDMTPLIYDSRCVLLGDDSLTTFATEAIRLRSQVTADLTIGKMQRLTLPGRVEQLQPGGRDFHKILVKFDRLDRLTAGRLRSLATSLV